MENFNVYEGIIDGLKEAVAYKQGDRSYCRSSVREIPVSKDGCQELEKTRQDPLFSERNKPTA